MTAKQNLERAEHKLTQIETWFKQGGVELITLFEARQEVAKLQNVINATVSRETK